MSALALFAKCPDQPTAFFLRRSLKFRWCYAHRCIGCGGRESSLQRTLSGGNINQHGESESFGHGGDS